MAVPAVVQSEELPPGMAYDQVWNDEYWRTRPITVTQRMITLGFAFVRWQLYKRVNGEQAAAVYLRTMLTTLGPACVKIGQAVSSRPDVIPPLYLAELEKLQDDIPPFPSDQAFATIVEELGRPVDQIFDGITPGPVAAASLGQVYKATLRSTGDRVAIKVQRPGVLETIALDIHILRRMAKWLRTARKLNSDLPALVDDWASSIYREMSYVRELKNAEEFRVLFRHYKEVYVPGMYPELSTEKVLTMEWVDGTKPRTGSQRMVPMAGVDDIALVEVGVRCSLEQMLQEGFYHADPHPGNILRMNDGRLCYLDFGMMGRIDRPVRQGLIRATLHMVNREFEELADDFVTLGLLPRDSTASREDIIQALTGIFDEALRDGVRNLNFGGLSTNLGRTMYKYKFRIPPYYTLLVRSLTILEGIALASDPNYKVLGAAYPWVARRLLTDRSPELRATLRNLLYDEVGMFRFERLESLLQQAVKSPPRSDSRIRQYNGVAAGALDLLLSSEGEYLREMMLDELAKGFDAAVRLNADTVTRTFRMSLMTGLGLTGQETAVETGAYSRVPASSVIVALMNLPKLADDTDVEQVRGIQRLSTLLQELAIQKAGDAHVPRRGRGEINDPGTPATTAVSATANASYILSWIAEEAQKLSPEQRTQLLALPLDLAQRVSSRAAARGLKLLVSSMDQQQKQQAALPAARSTPAAPASGR